MEIQLKTTDAAVGTNSVVLKIADDEDGNPLWAETRAPQLPNRQTQGRLDFSQFDPEVHLVWSEDSWHNGALQTYYRPDDPYRYATGHNIDARFEGVMAVFPPVDSSSGYENDDGPVLSVANDPEDTMWIGINTTGAGNSTSLPWTPSGGVGGVLGSGGYHGDGVMQVASGSLYAQMSIPTSLQGVSVTFRSRIRDVTSSSTWAMRITDSDGGQSDSSNVTSSSFTEVSATHSIGATATWVRVWLLLVVDGGSALGEIDDISLNMGTFGAAASFANKTYVSYGRFLLEYQPATNHWDVVYYAAADITDLKAFDSNLFIALGYSTAYVYTADASTFTISTATGADNKAKYWAVAKNASGTWALWKTETATSVSNATDPLNGSPDWTAPITVGDTSANITRIYEGFDTILVGKEDGLYGFTRFDPNSSAGDNLFESIDPTARAFPHVDNYSKGVFHNGWMWFKTAYHGLVRWRPGVYQKIESVFTKPRAGTFIPKVLDILSGPRNLWLLIGDSENGNSNFVCTLNETVEGRLVLHIHSTLTLRDSNGSQDKLFLDPDNGNIYIFGTDLMAQDTPDCDPFIWQFKWPVASPAPYLTNLGRVAKSPAVTATWETDIWHGGTPGEPKALLSLIMWVGDVDSNNTITVKFGVDGNAASTTTLGTLNTAGDIQTLYFHNLADPVSKATARAVQFEFSQTIADNQISGGAKIYAFTLVSALRTDRLRTFSCEVELSPAMLTDSGFEAPEEPDTVRDSLYTMEGQDYPIRLWLPKANTDGQEAELDKLSVFIRDIQPVRQVGDTERVRLILQEAKTSA